MSYEYGENHLSESYRNCERMLDRGMDAIKKSSPNPLERAGLTSDEVRQMTARLGMRGEGRTDHGPLPVETPRERVVSNEHTSVIRCWLRQHPGEWVTASRIGEDLDIHLNYIGFVLRTMVGDGEPIKVVRPNSGRGVVQYKWVGKNENE